MFAESITAPHQIGRSEVRAGNSPVALEPSLPSIQATQLGKVERLVKAILPANPFYTRKLARFSVPERFGSVDEYARLIPVTTRHELVRDRIENPPYGTNLTYPLDKFVRCHQTSGTTTVPIRWLDTPESWGHIVDNWVEILGAAGIHRGDRFFFAFSFGPFLGFWSGLEAAMKLGCFCFTGGAMTSLARLEAILDNGITVLCCTPTYAQHLGEVAAEKKIDLTRSRLRLVIVAGEGGGSIPATRARIEKLWVGARVFDHHGMTEVGPVSYQCPCQPGVLHILESAYLPEVVDPATGQPVRPGEAGELVLTTLDRLGSPLLRYRTGDLVRARPRMVCSCGRSELALEGGILGRSDDMVVVRGVNVYPSLVEEIVRAFPEVTEYRVLLDRRRPMAELSLEVEPAHPSPAVETLPPRLEEAFRTALNIRVPVKLLPAGSLPRFEMKAQRWMKVAD
jgi:phenylacetate-CoA ligase